MKDIDKNANLFLDFWNKADLKFSEDGYTHPCDNISKKYIQKNIKNYEDYIKFLMEGKLKSSDLHLNLLPQPYHGDLKNAKVFILLTNPSVSANNYYAEKEDIEYRKSLWDTLRQTRRNNEIVQHMFLDPKFAWTTGFTWWERKLRDVANEILKKSKKIHNYSEALEELSKTVASIELVPYHSRYAPSRTLFGSKPLASVNAAREFVQSIPKCRTIILTRSVDYWGLPDQDNIVKFDRQKAQAASLGRKSKAFDRIVKAVISRKCESSDAAG